MAPIRWYLNLQPPTYEPQLPAPCTAIDIPCTLAPCTLAPCTLAPCTLAPCTLAPCTLAPRTTINIPTLPALIQLLQL